MLWYVFLFVLFSVSFVMNISVCTKLHFVTKLLQRKCGWLVPSAINDSHWCGNCFSWGSYNMAFLYPFSNFIFHFVYVEFHSVSLDHFFSLDSDIRGRMELLYDKVLTTNRSTGERGGGGRDVICLTLPWRDFFFKELVPLQRLSFCFVGGGGGGFDSPPIPNVAN